MRGRSGVSGRLLRGGSQLSGHGASAQFARFGDRVDEALEAAAVAIERGDDECVAWVDAGVACLEFGAEDVSCSTSWAMASGRQPSFVTMSATWSGTDRNGEWEASSATTDVGLSGKAASASVMNLRCTAGRTAMSCAQVT